MSHTSQYLGDYVACNIRANQSNGGEYASTLGNAANSRTCEQPRQWERETFAGGHIRARVTASAEGRAWLLFGVDSGFESRTAIYFTRIRARFRRL